jgi:hypothetical protein
VIGIYILIFLLSLVVVAISIYAALVGGNIKHLENGRHPDAGVSLVGYVIFPVFFLGIAYLGNRISSGLGWYIAFGILSLVLMYTASTLPKQIQKYNALLKQRIQS